jgi:hypothetical protein
VKGKQAVLFLQKKNQKNSRSRGLGHDRATASSKQKFFAAFFQKSSACFLLSGAP